MNGFSEPACGPSGIGAGGAAAAGAARREQHDER